MPATEFQAWWAALSQRRIWSRALAWVLLTVTLIAAGWISVWHLAAELRQSGVALAEAKVQARAKSYGRQLDDLIGRLDQVGKVLVDEWREHPKSIDFNNILAGIYPRGMPLYVSVLDARGRVTASSVAPATAAGIGDGRVVEHHRTHCCDGWLVTPPEYSRTAGAEILHLSRPLTDREGRFAGVLVFGMTPDILTAFEDESAIGPGDFVDMRLVDGPVLASQFGAGQGALASYAVPPRFAMAQGVRLEGGHAFRDGVPRFVAWRKHSVLPIMAIAAISAERAMADDEAEVRVYYITASLVTVLLLMFCATGVMFTARLSLRNAAENEVRKVYRTATDAANEGFYLLRPLLDAAGQLADFQFDDVNERGGELLGQHRSLLLGQSASRVLPKPVFANVLDFVRRALKHNAVENEHRVIAGNGLPSRWLYCHAVAIGAGVALTLRDISQAKAHEEELLELAHRDNLTGLPNRLWLNRFLPAAIQRARHAHQLLAVLFIDLDHFKTVNDTLGHEAGDQLLRDIARYLREAVRASDHVVRLGGDEFLVIIENIEVVESIDVLAQKLIAAVEGQLRVLDGPVGKVGASIGISVFPQDGERADELLKHADIAMYQAKARGRGQHCRYLPEYSSRIAERLDSEQALRLALERDELFVHFQPKIRLRSGRLSGAEALVRWQRPGHGLVMPGSFIGLAEDLGLIVPIGERVIRCTMQQLAAWRDAGLPALRVAVNVSPEQLRRSDVAGFVQQELAAHDIAPDCIEIEITESTMVEQSEAVQGQLERLRALGVRLVIDDFGAGYSSLAQLQRLDVDVIKLDRELVMPLRPDSNAESLCRAIIWMASALGLEVVAEGVETVEQLRVLTDVGCDELQGYLFSEPLSAEDFEPLLRQPRTDIADWIGVAAASVSG